MRNEKKKIDELYFGVKGRVIMLALLFVFNLLIVVGASLHYTYGQPKILMIVGVIGTFASIAILSTPPQLSAESLAEKNIQHSPITEE